MEPPDPEAAACDDSPSASACCATPLRSLRCPDTPLPTRTAPWPLRKPLPDRSRLIQKPPHVMIPLRRARAVRLPCALFVARTHPYPRGQRLGHFESRCLGTDFGDHL